MYIVSEVIHKEFVLKKRFSPAPLPEAIILLGGYFDIYL